jgi:hypothetical protein
MPQRAAGAHARNQNGFHLHPDVLYLPQQRGKYTTPLSESARVSFSEWVIEHVLASDADMNKNIHASRRPLMTLILISNDAVIIAS